MRGRTDDLSAVFQRVSQSGELSGSPPGGAPEVTGKVGLVRVPEPGRNSAEGATSEPQLLPGVLQPPLADQPLRRDAQEPAAQPLQGPFIQAEGVTEGSNTGNFRVFFHPCRHPVGQDGLMSGGAKQ